MSTEDEAKQEATKQPDLAQLVPKRPRRVAVIVVHGVGNPARNRTSSQVADLLLRFAPSKVAPLEAAPLRIQVTPAPRGSASQKAAQSKSFFGKGLAKIDATFDTRTESVKLAHNSTSEQVDADAFGFNLMKDRLEGYEPDEDDKVYDTIRYSTRIGEGTGSDTREAHFYEMYWADLSSLGSGFLRAVFQLYSLIFDLCLLGRQTLDAALAQYPKSKIWRHFRTIQSVSEWLLVQPILLTNFLMVLLIPFLGLALVPPGLLLWIRLLYVPAVAVTLVGWASFHFASRIPPKSWMWGIFLIIPGIAIVSVINWWTARNPSAHTTFQLSVIYLVLTLGGFYLFAIRWYASRKPGASVTGFFLGVGFLTIFASQFSLNAYPYLKTDQDILIESVVRSYELVFSPLSLFWIALWVLIILASLIGWMAVSNHYTPTKDEIEINKLRRAAWTANLTLLLPCGTSLIATACIWGALVLSTQSHIEASFGSNAHHPALWFGLTDSSEPIASTTNTLLRTGLPVVPRATMMLTLAGILAAWTLAPAIWHEIFYPKSPKDAKGAPSTWLGQNLTAGFAGLRLTGEILRFLVIASTLQVLYSTLRTGRQDAFWNWELALVPFSLSLGGLTVIGIVASHGPFKFLTFGFYSALQAAIDVVNWMRVWPKSHNPQARICARYASLIRYLNSWRSPEDGGGYDAIIIISHSQGTVITCDFLRYLKRIEETTEGISDPVFDGRPIDLFTMGCPLRQLYGLRFPHIYAWARTESFASGELLPTKGKLWNVKTWLNAYRSGDYVGRSLWHDESSESSWTLDPNAKPANETSSEFCLGAGAHTHYWDDSAELVANSLVRLVKEA